MVCHGHGMRMTRDCEFPFTAVAGMEKARQALALLAVDPGLKGVLIAGGPGSAKSLLARAFGGVFADAPFVEAPAGVTEDRLTGALDWEQAIAMGRRELTPGLLARAHGGVLFVDEINRMPREQSRHIAAALGEGCMRVERDGISAVLPAGFALVGTYDPAGGSVDAALQDPVGMHVTERGDASLAARMEIARRVEAFDRNPAAFAECHGRQMAALRARIAAARRRLPRVDASDELIGRLSQAALEAGIEGHRADIFAARLVRARAAWMGRDSADESDFEAALELVLLPRARARSPEAEPSTAPASPGDAEGRDEDRLIPPADSAAPAGLLDFAAPGRHAGKREQRHTAGTRGRYVRATADRPASPRVAVEATLRAAAPYQRLRGPAGTPIRIEASDLRYKRFEAQRGGLVIFVADASGSMALNRMSQAKGAAMRLLREAYRRRDRVALIGFRGSRAEVLLPPGRSTEAAVRALGNLPAGGGTPLAAGLSAALELARRGRECDDREPLLVVLTDGCANVSRGAGGVWQELADVGAQVRSEGIASVVLDTSRRFVSAGEAARLARLLGGRHVALP